MNRRIFKSTWILAGLVAGTLPDAAAIAVADLPTSVVSPTNAGYAFNWDYVYKYKNASSVAVDWYWILTAAHVADDGGTGSLVIGGQTYTQQQIVYHPDADLALVRYDKPFPGYYPCSSVLPVGGEVVFCGYGFAGTVVSTPTAAYFTDSQTGNGVKRWGTNRIDNDITYIYLPPAPLGITTNMGFEVTISTTKTSAQKTDYEAGGNVYDSGAGLFYANGGRWELVGTMTTRTNNQVNYTGNFAVGTKYYLDWIQSVIVDYDTDMDGLPDWWETAFAGDALSMGAADNADGDGFTNYEEWLADTVPTNSASFPWIGPYTNAAQVVFGSSSNRQYQIEYRLDLADTNAVWGIEIPWFPGAQPQTEKTVTTLSSNRFFRLRVRLH